MSLSSLIAFLQQQAQGDLLPWAVQAEAASRFHITCQQVEAAALQSNLLPARYQRNRHTISLAQQRQLFQTTVAVIGCGGLGGYIIEELARLGIGKIVAIDPDVFEEHNLNRQLLSSLAFLGKPKVQAAAARVREINPAIVLVPIQAALDNGNGEKLLQGVTVVADALDSIATRLELAAVCEKLQLPLIHGGIAGWYGQLTTQMPGAQNLQKIYAGHEGQKRAEKILGNPAFTPAVIASLEVAEICKVVLGQGSLLTDRMLFVDLLEMKCQEVEL